MTHQRAQIPILSRRNSEGIFGRLLGRPKMHFDTTFLWKVREPFCSREQKGFRILQQVSVQKAILNGLENRFFANGFLVVEVGDRAGDFEDFCVSARREGELLDSPFE
jgi:hypothetical protein